MTTHDPTAPVASRVAVALKWVGIVVACVVVVVLITAAVLDANANALRGPLSRTAASHLGRPVHIDGRLELHLFSWHPTVAIHGLRIANPTWVEPNANPPSDMARIGQLRLTFSIPALFKGNLLLPYVGVDDSDLDLVRDAKQRANWDFSKRTPAKPSNQPARFPLLGSLHLGNGHLLVNDALRKLRFKGTVSADQRAHGEAQSLSLEGDGTINGESFKVTASGDPLMTAETHQPYTVAADLYYLSGLALPNTAPYTVSSHMTRQGSLLKLTNFKGTLGNSDIHGTLSLETAGDRPMRTAALTTRLLDIKDLGPTLGAKPKTAQTRTVEAQEADAKAAKGETLLPDAKLDLKRIRNMDANVSYRAEAVKTQKMSIREIVLTLKLDRGVLTFTPVSFVLPQGKLTSNIKVDGSKDVPEVDIDAWVTQVRLSTRS